MAAPLERPQTPASVALIGTVVALIIGFILLRMIIGFVITVTKIVIFVAIIAAVLVAVNRLVKD